MSGGLLQEVTKPATQSMVNGSMVRPTASSSSPETARISSRALDPKDVRRHLGLLLPTLFVIIGAQLKQVAGVPEYVSGRRGHHHQAHRHRSRRSVLAPGFHRWARSVRLSKIFITRDARPRRSPRVPRRVSPPGCPRRRALASSPVDIAPLLTSRRVDIPPTPSPVRVPVWMSSERFPTRRVRASRCSRRGTTSSPRGRTDPRARARRTPRAFSSPPPLASARRLFPSTPTVPAPPTSPLAACISRNLSAASTRSLVRNGS